LLRKKRRAEVDLDQILAIVILAMGLCAAGVIVAVLGGMAFGFVRFFP
jgi:hypothetical protein